MPGLLEVQQVGEEGEVDRLIGGAVARAVLAVLVVALAAVFAGGCTTARNSLGPKDSACFRVLPEAEAAVHHKGKFSGVRLTTAQILLTDLRKKPHPIAPIVEKALVQEAKDHPKSSLCLAAYKGSFDPSTVELGWSPTGQKGPWALVAIRLPSAVVVATIVLEKTPLSVSDQTF